MLQNCNIFRTKMKEILPTCFKLRAKLKSYLRNVAVTFLHLMGGLDTHYYSPVETLYITMSLLCKAQSCFFCIFSPLQIFCGTAITAALVRLKRKLTWVGQTKKNNGSCAEFGFNGNIERKMRVCDLSELTERKSQKPPSDNRNPQHENKSN